MSRFSDGPLPLPPASPRPLSPTTPINSHPHHHPHPFCHASHIAAYLDTYTRTHIYNNVSLYDRIIFNTRVTTTTASKALPSHRSHRSQPRWYLACTPPSGGKMVIVGTRTLIDCTGLASQPSIPAVQGQEGFRGLCIHQKDFARCEEGEGILAGAPCDEDEAGEGRGEGEEAHRGCWWGNGDGGDSGDSNCGGGGTNVSWVIREDGNGPAAFLPSKGAEGFYSRFVAGFLPCVFGTGNAGGRWWEGMLHRTRVGQWMVRKIWESVDRGYRDGANFGREQGEGMGRGFEGLESQTPVFWQNDSSGINQREDFWDVIADRVDVYRRNLKAIDEREITLAEEKGTGESGLTIPADLLIYCTGWSPQSALFDDATAAQLGLPVSIKYSESTNTPLDVAADAQVLSDFPALAHPPMYRRIEPALTPFRLYKTMAPVSENDDRSILFLGRLVVGNNFLVAEAQALWAVAYLDGHIACSQEEMERSVAETVAWSRRRYLNKGQLGIWFFFDVIKYADMLLAQLGLDSHKRKGWFGNVFSPLRAADLKSLLGEYNAKHKCKA
ncbi:uncharacterized protein KY384_003462 [Bacidia gigantensis]|uniref:uncharacterized protein n=1 Tax=Bacidia gigantensis TaxID=2732470 RepID=UPI001D054874|nr:uncharacterized protein KY384_003462 [Bacidia gigantensis]KAG8531826.1 hypothetical protein KY384_003462 [Bacidia gigantensis]